MLHNLFILIYIVGKIWHNRQYVNTMWNCKIGKIGWPAFVHDQRNEIPWTEFLKCLVETVIGIKSSVQRVRNQLTVSTSLRLFQERLIVKWKWGKLLNLRSLVSNYRIIWWDSFFYGFERSIDTTRNTTKKILVGWSYVKGISQRRIVPTVNRLNRGKFKYLKRMEKWKWKGK